MTTKRPDVLVRPPSDLVALTLAEMLVKKWRLRGACRACGLGVRVNLTTLIAVYGANKCWWGVQTPCPNESCEGGQLQYSAQSIRGGSWSSMARGPSQAAVTRWKNERGDGGWKGER